ncbi:DUF808 domain-containing protein [Mesonia aestuariivivens]|uniref:DUF808 domain-containing protein n=1 Tax=Mesonia aestuariivivens TaxID=2796128 RepID=A0ABS6W150_9FLAO|nr:DUF808 domain-containing protein [Mesonia aestuariivivens]MBW2961241.1 DUF808 domain-containing protein [Mesonia aestuariivivens]
MATGFLAILDDIAALMDDVAVMSKVAAKKTAGILGDDLAVNAEKASGFVSSREIPVLWAITKGSLLNKLIILPIAFLLSSFLPIAITIILLLGGFYLGFEGAEKIYHFFVPHKKNSKKEELKQVETKEEILALEKERVKSAILTDFILSVEIVIITLGTVVGEPIVEQIIVVSLIAILATIGVYGIVALIVRMDEAGYYLIEKSNKESGFKFKLGEFLVAALPKVIKGLTIIGTIALILVSGGIFVHNLDFIHHLIPEAIPSMIAEFIIGLIFGFFAVVIVKLFIKAKKRMFN